jgi:ribonucleotide reductase alpha subunit
MEARRSNIQHHPIGHRVQGLPDVFRLLRYPFDSESAKTLANDIFETIHSVAVEASFWISTSTPTSTTASLVWATHALMRY